MQVQQSHADRVQKSPAIDPAPVLHPFNEFDTALKRSQNYLLNVQKPEGYWVGELMVDVTLIADLVAYHHWDRSVDKEWEKKAVHHIFEKQLPDGACVPSALIKLPVSASWLPLGRIWLWALLATLMPMMF